MRYKTNYGPNKKVRQHARDTLEAIQKLNSDVLLRKHYTRRGGNQLLVLLGALKNWKIMLTPTKRSSRVVEKLTKLTIDDDVLDSPLLRTEEKCSG